jgi:cysteine synthase B
MICSRKGYPLKVVMPDNVTPERTQLLQMYGAEIVYSPGDQGSNGAVAMALEMARPTPRTTCLPVRQPRPTRARTTTARRRDPRGARRDQPRSWPASGTGGTLMGNGRRCARSSATA